MRNIPVPHPPGNLRLSKFNPDEFVMVFLPLTVNTEYTSLQPGEGRAAKHNLIKHGKIRPQQNVMQP